MTAFLSGAQLVNAHSKSDHELPSAGVKEFHPTHSWLENKQVQNALDQRKALLEEERVEKWSSLMKAEWMPQKHKAEVKTKGKHWEVFGHHSDNVDWLFPEEVLLLMEMNCLECFYAEVPLSIQKGYTVLLHPEHGCSLNEYRVFAHLCRTGYRVVRHIPDLTVTAYEKQIRLDQHLDQRKTYSDTTSAESDLPRPDLPPKRIVDLPENTEIKIESGNAPLDSAENTTLEVDKTNVIGEVLVHKQQDPKYIEVIDIMDSSSDSESSSDDSIIEIVHEHGPGLKSIKDVRDPKLKKEGATHYYDGDNDDDNDIEIIEVSFPKKEIIVATIESSDSEKENSDSKSEKSYDGNWKRCQQSRRKRKFVRSSSMENFNFSAVDEFCVEKSLTSEVNQDCLQSISQEDQEMQTSNSDIDVSNPVSGMGIEQPRRKRIRPMFSVIKSRTEILNLMPSMAGINSKLMSLETPDSSLIPASIVPKSKIYTFNTNTLRARVFSIYRSGFRGRRNFHGPRFNNYYNPYYSTFPNQMGVRNPLLHALPLPQMFGSDIQSMARGMMQFASALLLNIPQNNQTNRVMPYNSQQSFNFSSSHDSQSSFSSQPLFNDSSRSFTTPNHIRFSESSFSSDSPQNVTTDSFSRNYRSDYLRNSGNRSDFDSSERTFTPPIASVRERKCIHSNVLNCSRRNSRNYHGRSGRFASSPRNFRAVDPVFPKVDPAYLKSDVPLVQEQNINSGGSGDFILLSSTNKKPLEVIDIVDGDDNCLANKHSGISNRFQRKRKKKWRQQMRKRGCQDNQSMIKDEPVVVFIDSPTISSQSIEAIPLKQESNQDSNVNIKSEDSSGQTPSIKRELNEDNSSIHVKNESLDDNLIKVENSVASGQDAAIKNEGNNEVRVNIGQNMSGTNLQIEIQIENSNDISLTPIVKAEPGATVKTEPDSSSEVQSVTNVKTEPIVRNAEVKIEHSDDGIDVKAGIIHHNIPQIEQVEVSSSTSAVVDMSGIECETEGLNETEKNLLENSNSCSHVARSFAKEDSSLRNVDDNSDMDVMTTEESEVSDSSRTKQVIISELPKEKEMSRLECETEGLNETEKNLLENSDSCSHVARSFAREDISLRNVDDNSEMDIETTEESKVSDSSRTKQVNNSELPKEKDMSGIECETEGINETEKNLLENSDSCSHVARSFAEEDSSLRNVDDNIDMDIMTTEESKASDSSRTKHVINSELPKEKETCGEILSETSSNEETRTICVDKQNEKSCSKLSSWADVKKYNVSLASSQNNEVGEEPMDTEEEDEIHSLVRPKHCKTIGTVLTALQIFSPFSPKVTQSISKLKISFDMYLPADFRKSQRGLPHYRIVVFEGKESLPSSAQIHELQTRFQDSVPVLRAVVMPDSVVFYSCTKICLPVDLSFYKE